MYDITRQFPQTLIDLLSRQDRQNDFKPIFLGGSSGSNGGTGGNPGGFVGRLPQTRVCYDTTEASSSGSTTSGSIPSLVDNLNRIRYDIRHTQEGWIPINGGLSWTSGSLTSSGGTGSGSPAGSNTWVQYNTSGSFGADSNFVWKTALQRLEIGGAPPVSNPNTSGINLVGDAARGPLTAQIAQWYFGAGSNPSYIGVKAGGTIATPTVPVNGDTLVSLSGKGFIGPLATDFSLVAARVGLYANETFSTTNQGSRVDVWTTPLGTTAANKAVVARFDNVSGITNLATNLYTTKDFVLTAAKTGSLPVGTGVVGRVAEWVTDANTLQASTLIKSGAGVLTLATGAAASATWTLPSPLNAAGYLKNDGAGALSWDAGTGWALLGNTGTDPAVNFVGTSDATDLILARNSAPRVRVGVNGVGIGLIPPVPNCLLDIECNTGISLNGAVLIKDIDGGADGKGNSAIDFLRTGAHPADFTLGIPSTETCFALYATGSGNYYFDVARLTGQFTLHGYDGVTPPLKVQYDVDNYFTANVSAAGVTTFATLPVGAGFVFTPPVTFSALTATGIVYAGTAGLLSSSTNATLDGTGNVYVARLQVASTGTGAILNVLRSTDGAVAHFDIASGKYAWQAFQVSGVNKGYIQWNMNDAGSGVGTAMIVNNAQGKLHLWDNTNTGIAISGGAATITSAFGCNTKAAQGAFASGGALAAYATGAFGLDSDAKMSAMHALVVAIRAALVANGIMS